jgi:hypothetical protein
MRPGVTRRHLLRGLIAGQLLGASPVGPGRSRAGRAAGVYLPARAEHQPVRRADADQGELTYRRPRCARQVVERDWRLAEVCSPYTSAGPDPRP